MNPAERQRVKLWLVLMVLLAGAYALGRGIYDLGPAAEDAPPAAAVATPLLDPASLAVAPGVKARQPGGSPPDGPRRNPFEYGPEPKAEPDVSSPPPVAPPGVTAAPARPPTPPPPPPPPPIPFRYSGYSSVGPGGRLQAWLFEDGESYGVTEGEVLVGRYRINAVTTEYVEVEDLEFSRRQRLPLLVEE